MNIASTSATTTLGEIDAITFMGITLFAISFLLTYYLFRKFIK